MHCRMNTVMMACTKHQESAEGKKRGVAVAHLNTCICKIQPIKKCTITKSCEYLLIYQLNLSTYKVNLMIITTHIINLAFISWLRQLEG